MPAEELTVELRSEPDQVTVKVRGDLDLRTVGRLRTALADLCAREQSCGITVDLTEVRFFGALTVGMFARTAKQLQGEGCHFHVHGLTPFQERLMRLYGLEQRIPIS
jgi:anti-anti-sigma factor